LKKENAIIVTTTYSKTGEDARAQLALKTCRTAVKAGYPILVVDGGSQVGYKAQLRKAGAIVQDQKAMGMGQSRRECIRAGLATGAGVIVWMEPEKYPLIPFLGSCIEPILADEADIVIPRRASLESYPDYQHFSELRGNWSLGNILGCYGFDLFFGPRVMSRAVAEKVASYDGRIDGKTVYGDNWEILFVPIIQMVADGVRIKSVTVGYSHPSAQHDEDGESFRCKRDKQRNDIVSAMMSEAKRLGLYRR